eukprot:CAMPEP_0113477790 /NCGR_PEP_ID=MMETSP0014_2-20120614/20391_1 /TAXON_ID=2857 /ORGANISM="Nitzschia sp." /LENGTH=374 /DNA_ID=CAMNT_0000370899 /DNA_START=200 /DNA_END=1320 /DNA_ORIENTATION=+ /assembly_acc=CAM_ASM_000159
MSLQKNNQSLVLVVVIMMAMASTRVVVSLSPSSALSSLHGRNDVQNINRSHHHHTATSFVALNMASRRRTTTIDVLGVEDTDDITTESSTDLLTPTTTAKNLMAANDDDDLSLLTVALATSTMGLLVLCEAANAAIEMPKSLQTSFDPSSFVPVCSASDTFYRFLQSSAQAVVGPENFVQYGPLIASGLLRIRLELCVVESFFNEAVGPFIAKNGLSWVLPLHETVETFLAGTVFALATTFILVGSTKILTVLFTYADFLLGAPSRFFGGYIFDRARGKPVTLDIGFGPFKTRVIGPKDAPAETNNMDYSVDFDSISAGEIPFVILSGSLKALGQVIGFLREILDAIDLFVGKSLVLWVTFYVLIKFLHFKVFP